MSLIPSEIEWKNAEGPNYQTNEDLRYPYSDKPYEGQNELEKIPSEDVIPLVDYWGEGYVETEDGVQGFKNCYNINHEHRLVCYGKDKSRKIPNRIPVKSYTDCDTSAYIKDGSVKVVTVMGMPIDESCAKDIARILHPRGKVIVYGFDETCEDLNILERALEDIDFAPCPGLELPNELKMSSFDIHQVYMNEDGIENEIYEAILKGSYDRKSTNLGGVLERTETFIINTLLKKLLKENPENILTMAYTLMGSSAVFKSRLPVEILNIFESKWIQITNKKDDLSLTLSKTADKEGDRIALAEPIANTNQWKFIPNFKNNKVFFKILNQEHGLYLKAKHENKDGEIEVCGGYLEESHDAYTWELILQSLDDALFQIKNVKFNNVLKVDFDVLGDGKRRVNLDVGKGKKRDGETQWLIDTVG